MHVPDGAFGSPGVTAGSRTNARPDESFRRSTVGGQTHQKAKAAGGPLSLLSRPHEGRGLQGCRHASKADVKPGSVVRQEALRQLRAPPADGQTGSEEGTRPGPTPLPVNPEMASVSPPGSFTPTCVPHRPCVSALVTAPADPFERATAPHHGALPSCVVSVDFGRSVLDNTLRMVEHRVPGTPTFAVPGARKGWETGQGEPPWLIRSRAATRHWSPL